MFGENRVIIYKNARYATRYTTRYATCYAINCTTYHYMKIQNYDVEDDEKNDFIQLHDFMPDRCFRCLVSAPSGSGKTNLLLDMIYRLLYFDKIYLYARNLQQSKYKHLLKSLEPISKQVGYDVIEASNDEIIPLTDLPEENQKIVIFDDYLNTGKKNDERIRDYFTNSRNKNCCCIYLSQSFYNTDKTIRLNSSHHCIFDFHRGTNNQ